MKEIPKDKQKFYSKEHQNLRKSRIKLAYALLQSEIEISNLSKLEIEILTTGLKNILRKGKQVYVTFDSRSYKGQKTDPDNIYILCDQQGNLQDIIPLLDYIPPEMKEQYIAKRSKYLSN